MAPAEVEDKSASFDAAKEVVSLHVLLRLHYPEVLTKGNEQVQSALLTYRRNLAWTLIQPQGSALRKECWRWVTIIAEQIPAVFVNIIENYIGEGEYAVKFLISEHQTKIEQWKASLSGETKIPLHDWAEQQKKTMAAITDSENTVLHHTLALKVMQKLMSAYKDDNHEAKKAILAL